MKIIKNILDYNTFKDLQNLIISDQLAYYLGQPTETDNNCYFIHRIYEYDEPKSFLFKKIEPLLIKLKVKSLIRAKVNLFPKTEKLISYGKHIDLPYEHKGCVFSLNNCDGFTQIGNQNIPSIENQVFLFNSNMEHNSTSTTNAPFRININLNYF